MSLIYWRLDATGEPERWLGPAGDLQARAAWQGDAWVDPRGIVAQEVFPQGEVSTVFIPRSLSTDDPPRLWETLVFSPHRKTVLYEQKYATRAEAEAGHRAMVQRLLETSEEWSSDDQ